MFRNLNKSPLNDSSGLKFMEYLANDAEREKQNKPTVRGRKRLFRLQSDATSDDFSIHRVPEKENTLHVPQQTSPETTRTARSSTFKPSVASTPMVPTTQQTPYRASRKSIGIQNSPLVESPMQQDNREVPETPEAVAPQPLIPKTPIAAPKTPIAPKTPVVNKTLVAPPTPLAQNIISPPPQFTQKTPAPPIYPELETVGTQQKAIPEVIPATQPVVLPTQKTPALVQNEPPRVANVVPTVAPSPMVEIPSQNIQPLVQTQRSTRCVSPERLMEIIHCGTPAGPDILGSPRNLSKEIDANAIASPPPVQHTEAVAMVNTPRPRKSYRASICTPHPASVHKSPAAAAIIAAETPRSSAPRVRGRPRDLVERMGNETPKTSTRRSPERLADITEDIPDTQEVADMQEIPETEEMPVDPPEPDVIKTPVRAGRKAHLDDSSFFVAPTPVLKNFKLVVTDCLKSATNQAEKKAEETIMPPPPTTAAKSARGRPRKSVATARTSKASEMSISRENRSSIIVPSTQKRRLHSIARELTPISSPVPRENSMREIEEIEQLPESQPLAEPLPNTPIPDLAASGDEADDEAVVGPEDAAPLATSIKRPRAPARKKKAASPPPEPSEPTPPTPQDTPVTPADDDFVFKKPAPKSKKTTGPRKKKVVEPVDDDMEAGSSSDSTVRKSKRAPKPVGLVLPYSLKDKVDLTQMSINYNPSFRDYIKQQPTRNTNKKPAPRKPKDSGDSESDAKGKRSTSSGTSKTTKAKAKSSPKKAKKSKTHDRETDSGKESVMEPFDMPTMSSRVSREETSMEPFKNPKSSYSTTKRTTGEESSSRHKKDRMRNNSVASQCTYSNNFSRDLAPSSSTGVNWSTTVAPTEVTKTLETDNAIGVDGEYPRYSEHSWGSIMSYMDCSKGVIRLKSFKKRSRVQTKPLVMNVVVGEAIVNIESEGRAVRLGYLDQIKLSVGAKYTLENVGTVDTATMANAEGVNVKVAEKYRIAPITVPQELLSRLSGDHSRAVVAATEVEYDFGLERSVIKKIDEWRRVHDQTEHVRQEELQARDRERRQLLEAQQKQLLNQVSYPSTDDLSSDDEEVAVKPSNGSPGDSSTQKCPTSASAPVSAPTAAAHLQSDFSTILTPTVVPENATSSAKSTPATKPREMGHSGSVHSIGSINYSEWETDNYSPFDRMELKSINDLDILAQVLQTTQMNRNTASPPSEKAEEDNQTTTATDVPQSPPPSPVETKSEEIPQVNSDLFGQDTASQPIHSAGPALANAAYSWNNSHIASPATTATTATTFPQQQQHYPAPIITYPGYGHHNHQQQFNSNSGYIPTAVTNGGALGYYSHNPHQPYQSNVHQHVTTAYNYMASAAIPPQYSQPAITPLVNALGMGTSQANEQQSNSSLLRMRSKSVPDIVNELEEELKASEQRRRVRNNSQSSKRVEPESDEDDEEARADEKESAFDRLPSESKDLAMKISKMGFPIDVVSTVVEQLGNDDKKIIEHLIPLSELLDLGFGISPTSEALLKFNNNRERALDFLIS